MKSNFEVSCLCVIAFFVFSFEVSTYVTATDNAGFHVDFTTAQRILKEAEAGSEHSQYYSGLIFLYGTGGFEADGVLATHWLKKAALAGNVDAQGVLGRVLLEGKLVQQDYAAAASYLKKAALAGDAQAQWLLGTMYFDGLINSNNGVNRPLLREERYDAAYRWFSKSADQGNPHGQVNLGIMYEYGLGLAKPEFIKARQMYKAAADQGDAEGMFYLGILYLHGRGVVQNMEKGATLISESANIGYIPSMDTLGKLYTHGQGVPRDYVVAAAWFDKAEKGALEKTKTNDRYHQFLSEKSGEARKQLENGIYESEKLMADQMRKYYL